MKQDWQAIFEKAQQAAHDAGAAAIPDAMIVSECNPVTGSPEGKQWLVNDGICGFAWVNVKPATSSFAKWAKKEGKARKSYSGGLDIWVHEFGQSMQRKEAAAHAMASVLRESGLNAYPQSRMD